MAPDTHCREQREQVMLFRPSVIAPEHETVGIERLDEVVRKIEASSAFV
jgi:hypothetical protein